MYPFGWYPAVHHRYMLTNVWWNTFFILSRAKEGGKNGILDALSLTYGKYGESRNYAILNSCCRIKTLTFGWTCTFPCASLQTELGLNLIHKNLNLISHMHF